MYPDHGFRRACRIGAGERRGPCGKERWYQCDVSADAAVWVQLRGVGSAMVAMGVQTDAPSTLFVPAGHGVADVLPVPLA
jgi:hypothetical protein